MKKLAKVKKSKWCEPKFFIIDWLATTRVNVCCLFESTGKKGKKKGESKLKRCRWKLVFDSCGGKKKE